MRAEPVRKKQLIEAAILEVGTEGTLNVTVGRIAKRAGVSPALAFHYFGDKEQLFLSAMRHILTVYGQEVRSALGKAETPAQRLEAIVRASFSDTNFRAEVISAWLNFYVLAKQSDEARRLLLIYQKRLHSNLVHALRPEMGTRSREIALRIGALIDGLYLRCAISGEGQGADAARQVLATLGDTGVRT